MDSLRSPWHTSDLGKVCYESIFSLHISSEMRTKALCTSVESICPECQALLQASIPTSSKQNSKSVLFDLLESSTFIALPHPRKPCTRAPCQTRGPAIHTRKHRRIEERSPRAWCCSAPLLSSAEPGSESISRHSSASGESHA